jgi:hypothetical protein
MGKTKPHSRPPNEIEREQRLVEYPNLAKPIYLHGQVNDLLTLNLIAVRELPESCRDIAALRSALSTRLLLLVSTGSGSHGPT